MLTGFGRREREGNSVAVDFHPNLLRAARSAAGLSAAAIADVVGASDGATVRAWERGATAPSVHRIPLLAKALDIDALHLVCGEVARPSMKSLRRAAGLTLVELSRRTGLGYARCRQLETGSVGVAQIEVAEIARATGFSQARVREAIT